MSTARVSHSCECEHKSWTRFENKQRALKLSRSLAFIIPRETLPACGIVLSFQIELMTVELFCLQLKRFPYSHKLKWTMSHWLKPLNVLQHSKTNSYRLSYTSNTESHYKHLLTLHINRLHELPRVQSHQQVFNNRNPGTTNISDIRSGLQTSNFDLSLLWSIVKELDAGQTM